nr:hypothetical protein [uncultured Actinotalea sp.]
MRSWAAGRLFTLALGSVLTGLLAVAAIADVRTVAGLAADEEAWLAAGGRVLVASNDDGGVPRLACERLRALDGVVAAGSASRERAPASLVSAPGAALPLVTVTEGVAGLLQVPPGAVLAPTPAQALGVSAGDRVVLAPRGASAVTDPPASPGGAVGAGATWSGPLEVPVGAVTDLALLGEERSTGLLVPVAALGTADACFVRAGPGHVDGLREALPAVLQQDGRPAVVVDRLSSGPFVRDYVTEYEERGLRHAPWVVGAVAGLLWALVRWLRRSQDGLYATLGATAGTRAIIRLVEWLLHIGGASVLAVGVAVVVLAGSGTPADVLWPHLLRAVGMAVSVATAGALLATLVPLRSPLAALKDR